MDCGCNGFLGDISLVIASYNELFISTQNNSWVLLKKWFFLFVVRFGFVQLRKFKSLLILSFFLKRISKSLLNWWNACSLIFDIIFVSERVSWIGSKKLHGKRLQTSLWVTWLSISSLYENAWSTRWVFLFQKKKYILSNSYWSNVWKYINFSIFIFQDTNWGQHHVGSCARQILPESTVSSPTHARIRDGSNSFKHCGFFCSQQSCTIHNISSRSFTR